MSVYERCLCKLLTAGKDEKDHKWYGLIESRKKREFVRRVHVSEIKDADRRGQHWAKDYCQNVCAHSMQMSYHHLFVHFKYENAQRVQ